MFNYNLEAITKIRVGKKDKATWWHWKPERTKFFGLIKFPAGFYYSFTIDAPEYHENCPDNYYLEDGIVYENPNLTLYFNNQSSRTLYYKNMEELKTVLKDIKSRSNHQWLEI